MAARGVASKHACLKRGFNNIDRARRNDEGLAFKLDYAEQSNGLLFLEYLVDLQKERKDQLDLEERYYTSILEPEYCWGAWATPKNAKAA